MAVATSNLQFANARVVLKSMLRFGCMVLLLIGCWGLSALNSPVANALPPGNAITDGKALLRYALPIDNKPIREIQADLENLSDALRARRIAGVTRGIDAADKVLTRKEAEILASIPPERQAEASDLIAQLKTGLDEVRTEAANGNKEAVWAKRSQLLDRVGELEALMVNKFPFEVPEEYANLPQLKGRATVEVETNKGTMTLVVDGYNAPITAGNFVDLVQRGFYDGLEFTRAEDNYVLQIGDPPGKEVGFIDPKTNKYRAIPLEVMVQGDKKPLYGITLEDAGRYLDQPVLPFSAFGALGMARPGDDVNGGSSQFFFFLFEPELTPAGLNLLDGRYAVFGYVTENKDVLEKLKQGDKIISARVVDGLENLVEPS
ncbi:MAG: peptidylprolyl isomerase [Leptolyngbya sp. IPPAS B-1204]|nr:peptidylprolyl isomerase [Elainella sp. C42_A2020_010]RNJ66095.1 MAG: peptidylprolyl isomerase [Leptolyngbya sp. IPPAS B-1204]